MSLYVEALVIYPVKSCEGITLQEAEVGVHGFKYDRKWVIVDDEGAFVTRRSLPKLVTIETALEKDVATRRSTLTLSCSAEGAPPPVHIEEQFLSDPGKRTAKHITVWDYAGSNWDCGSAASEWLTAVIGNGRRYHLTQFADDARRELGRHHFARWNIPTPDDMYTTAFADGYPYLLVTAASLDDISNRSKENGGKALDWRRFRPNIIIGGAGVHEDDTWGELSIGNANFQLITACERCVMTTLNTDTLKFDRPTSQANPMALMKSFRDFGRGNLFGSNCVSPSLGCMVHVCDEVEVIREKSEAHRTGDLESHPRTEAAKRKQKICAALTLSALSAALGLWWVRK